VEGVLRGDEIVAALEHVRGPLYVVRRGLESVVVTCAAFENARDAGDAQDQTQIFSVGALGPQALGDRAFCRAHGVRYAYVAGAMANGIASEELVEAIGRAGMVGFFGAAGLSLERVERAIARIQQALGPAGHTYGFNLIHSPDDPQLESAIAELYLRRGVRLVSASAYLRLTLPLVRYRVSGIHRDEAGRVVAPNRVVAKVSRVEVARQFLSPPPTEMLDELVRDGAITREQAELAQRIPLAEDLTAEADSGGHTDNRPALTLLPTMLALRDELQRAHQYASVPRIGAAGGIATPAAACAAFSMGAAYILTGTINQACVEAGTSDAVKQMLAEARQADVTMAPAADMFEMGVKVQVLKRGTMFAIRARKLYDLYRSCAGMDEIPPAQRTMIERDLLRCTLGEAWEQTQAFFAARDPGQIERAQRDPKHKLALVFRSYLGQSSNWANAGKPDRRVDYQIWCGPAMGAFNEWVRGSCLEPAGGREVAVVAMNLLVGAAALTRANWLGALGVALPPGARRFEPRGADALSEILSGAVEECAA